MSAYQFDPQGRTIHPVGTQFVLAGRKNHCVHTVRDVLTTRNLAGEIVSVEFLCTHEFCGQTVTSRENATTIARGIVELAELRRKGKL